MIESNKNSVTSKWVVAKKPAPVKSLLAFGLIAAIGLSGCQPNTEDGNKAQNSTQEVANGNAVSMSPEAKTQVANFETEFVNRMLDLQQSQLAEYEALQAADSPDDSPINNDSSAINKSPSTGVVESQTITDETSNLSLKSKTASEAAVKAATDEATNQPANEAVDANKVPSIDSGKKGTDTEEVTLQELPLIKLAIAPPQELSAKEIGRRYNEAMQSLYLADETPISAQAIDTLLSIATLTPQVFNNAELAERLVIKSPALARMLKQYQIWEQIERQQSAELEALKQSQIEEQQKKVAEFDRLATEFNEKIEDYDKQIEQYQQKLKQFK
ncbi:restriction endonuclease subunit S domain-containing protein [Psychrobacter sanguinis]|uniref:hypothetical protein n=1 Tax=Psychrobacter sanguinis TaxID=861445 RepID=UPI001918170D|nr:hypothetical protein [Psychrobacter sanguinis]MCC3345977.1 hypothetical protein [Psychrobacter sanguinis]